MENGVFLSEVEDVNRYWVICEIFVRISLARRVQLGTDWFQRSAVTIAQFE